MCEGEREREEREKDVCVKTDEHVSCRTRVAPERERARGRVSVMSKPSSALYREAGSVREYVVYRRSSNV